MKPQIKWALAAAAVLLVGFVSLQQTGALWRSDAQGSDGAKITAGTLNISAGGEGVKEFTLSDLELTDASAGQSVQMPLPVINSGNVAMRYKLNSAEINGNVPLLLRIAAVGAQSECTETGDVGTELYSGALGTAFFTPRMVAKETTEVLCLRVTIGDSPQPGQSANATFTFGAESVART